MGSPVLSPAGTPGGSSSPRLSVRRSLSGLTRLFSAGASASDVVVDGSVGSCLAAPPAVPSFDDGSRLSAGGLQPSLMAADASGSSSGRQTPSGEPWLVMLPKQTAQSTRQGHARSGVGSDKPAPGSASTSSSAGLVSVKKLRVAGRLLEELETEANAADLDEDYIGATPCSKALHARGLPAAPTDTCLPPALAAAHLLTLSLTSALASVPPEVQGRVFAQSPQLSLLPQPGFRFEYLTSDDQPWKERAADGLGKGLAALWVSGIPVCPHLALQIGSGR